MKRIICYLALAAALMAVSCAQNKEQDLPDYLLGGTPVEVTFGVNTGTGLMTKAVADGTAATQLRTAWYEVTDNGPVFCNSKTAVLDGLSADVVLSLLKGKTYKVVFWASAEASPYTLDFAAGTVTMGSTLTANAEANDAFYKVVEYTVAATNEAQAVTLIRPVAQVAVLSPKTNIDGNDIALETTGITVESAYTQMNLLTGECSEAGERTFVNAAIDYQNEEAPRNGYYYVAVGYILASENGSVSNVSFNANGEAALTYEVANVQLKRNYRTLISGNLLPGEGTDADIDWSVTIDPTFGGDNDANVVAPTVTFSEPGEDSVVPAPYVEELGDDNESMDLDPQTSNVVFPVISNSETPITVESSVPEVATAEIDGENNVTVTAVSNGETLITVHQEATENNPNGIKTKGTEQEAVSYSAYDYTFLVRVTGIGVQSEAVYTLVTDASELGAGDKLLILNLDGDFAMGAQKGTYRQREEVTVEDDSVTDPDESIQIVTLEGTEGAWNLSVDDGYLTAPDETRNQLLTKTSVTDLGTWSISVESDGQATVYAAGAVEDSGYLSYNQTSPRFSCYRPGSVNGTNITRVALYRLAGDLSPDAILAYEEIGVYVTGKDPRPYISGTDQYIREYNGNNLTFVLVDPTTNEQVEVFGYNTTYLVGAAVPVTLNWRKGGSTVLSKSYNMEVVKQEGKKVWLGDVRGNGFIIKK